MEKIKICFKLLGQPQEVELNADEFGKYIACAIAEESWKVKDPLVIDCEGFTDEMIEKYGEIPFIYNNEEYSLMLLVGNYSLEIHKRGDEGFVEYSVFHLSV